jgi:nucleoside-diphosphate-sugar epimerase
MICTVIGHNGYIGSNLSAYLRALSYEVRTLPRGIRVDDSESLGHVFYCAGVTGDFLSRPYDTVEAHVAFVNTLVELGKFESFLYLSSTRIYGNAASTSEAEPISLKSWPGVDLYNLSKLMGEAICLARQSEKIRVARLSNVVGPSMGETNFLGKVLGSTLRGHVRLLTSLESEKDYVLLKDILGLLCNIALTGRHRVYNVASGANLTHNDLLRAMQRIKAFEIEVAHESPLIRPTPIDVSRIKNEFNFSPISLLDEIPQLMGVTK